MSDLTLTAADLNARAAPHTKTISEEFEELTAKVKAALEEVKADWLEEEKMFYDAIAAREEKIVELEQRAAAQAQQITALEQENAELKERVAALENDKARL